MNALSRLWLYVAIAVAAGSGGFVLGQRWPGDQQPAAVAEAPPTAPSPEATAESAVAAALIEAAKAEAVERFKDPVSAQFRNVRINQNGDVCLEVNGKNSYGGYTGFTAFRFLRDVQARRIEASDAALDRLELLSPKSAGEAYRSMAARNQRMATECGAEAPAARPLDEREK